MNVVCNNAVPTGEGITHGRSSRHQVKNSTAIFSFKSRINCVSDEIDDLAFGTHILDELDGRVPTRKGLGPNKEAQLVAGNRHNSLTVVI